MIAQHPVPTPKRKLDQYQQETLEKQKLNSCRSAPFHMNPRASPKYPLNDCIPLNMLINIIKHHCLSHSKCGVCCIKAFLCSLDIFCSVELCLCALYLNATVERFFNYLRIVKTEQRCRLNGRNIEFLLHIKVEGPELKEAADKMCTDADTLWWDSKEHHTTQ